MIDPICKDLTQWQHYSVILIVALVEMWLGRTSKTKSGSLIELLINFIRSMVERMKKNKES